jgi:hypothetical protein
LETVRFRTRLTVSRAITEHLRGNDAKGDDEGGGTDFCLAAASLVAAPFDYLRERVDQQLFGAAFELRAFSALASPQLRLNFL